MPFANEINLAEMAKAEELLETLQETLREIECRNAALRGRIEKLEEKVRRLRRERT